MIDMVLAMGNQIFHIPFHLLVVTMTMDIVDGIIGPYHLHEVSAIIVVQIHVIYAVILEIFVVILVETSEANLGIIAILVII